MSYLDLPELVAILWMAVVLARLRNWQNDNLIYLWIVGLFLFVVEGIARILYLSPLSPTLHALMHVTALNAYFLAGVAFLQSATGRLRFLPHSRTYLFICSLPHIVLLTMYGSSAQNRASFVAVSVAGLLATSLAAGYLRRNYLHQVCHWIVWLSIIAAAVNYKFRLLAYLSLFFTYFATAIAFFVSLPNQRKGRAVVVAGFCIWSLCFITHPWLAETHPYWLPLAERIWDLQKFFVMFGLLIVSLEESSADSQYQALHDTLTGLPNRRLFDDRLEQALARSNRNATRVVLFNMDLDGFKQVNDTLGHQAGDQLLREVGYRLLSVTRESDTLARIGGDEFYLLINDFNPQRSSKASPTLADMLDQVDRLSEHFRSAVEETPCSLAVGEATHKLHVQLSIGCTIFPDQANSRNELCRLADQNMYANKKRRAESATALAIAPVQNA